MGLRRVRDGDHSGFGSVMFHKHNLSRVWTVNGRSYQVCLTCSREFLYDLKAMKRLDEVRPKRVRLQLLKKGVA
jgi:hypothetical protein